jgi:hypothetical protein
MGLSVAIDITFAAGNCINSRASLSENTADSRPIDTIGSLSLEKGG